MYVLWTLLHTCMYCMRIMCRAYSGPCSDTMYSGTSDNGHSEKWTTSVERTNCLPPTNCNIHSVPSEIGTTSVERTNCLPPTNCCIHVHSVPSEIGTTSLQWTEGLSPLCPLFGGSTEHYACDVHHRWPLVHATGARTNRLSSASSHPQWL